MSSPAITPSDRVLLVGGTCFVGARLIPKLMNKNIKLRLLVRDVATAAPLVPMGSDAEVVQGT